VGAGFDGAPVVARGNHDRIHAVHDALVVRRSAIRIDRGKRPRLNDAVSHALTGEVTERELFDTNGAARASHTPIGEVRKNAQVHAPAGDLFDRRRQGFASRVNGVRAHCVARVVDQVNYQERSDR